MLFASILISLFSSLVILPMVIGFIDDRKTINYRSAGILNSCGIFFSLNILLIAAFMAIFNTVNNTALDVRNHLTAILSGVFASSFTGMMDDSSKDRTKGISGHFKSFFRGYLTSGFIKAVTGVLISVIINLMMGYRGYELMLGIMLLPISQNLVNLFDLRPLRAIKAYSAVSLLFLPFSNFHTPYVYINIGMLISFLFYWRYEAAEICMMGDTGSNTLGFLLGLVILNSKVFAIKLSILILFILIQVFAEKRSISAVIEKSRILKAIDMLGRNRIVDKNKKGKS
jgi:Glycosyl transferase family 4.